MLTNCLIPHAAAQAQQALTALLAHILALFPGPAFRHLQCMELQFKDVECSITVQLHM